MKTVVLLFSSSQFHVDSFQFNNSVDVAKLINNKLIWTYKAALQRADP